MPTEAAKDFWKLIMNSNYGNFLQDVIDLLSTTFVQQENTLNKHFNNAYYKGHCSLAENTVVVFKKQAVVRMNRLYVCGFTILELTKRHMYSCYYDFIQPTWGVDHVSLVLTDTVSLLLHVKGMSRDQMFDKLDPIMDYSNYPTDHPRYSTDLKAVPAYLKDENRGNIMQEVVGLRSKCYMFEVLNNSERVSTIVCKGVTASERKKLSLELYLSCIEDFKEIKVKMTTILAKKHTLYTQELRKITFVEQ